MNFKKYTISNFLIYISWLFTLISYFYPDILVFWINNVFLNNKVYYIYFLQIFIWTFLHWWMLHFLSNSIFIYLFWNVLELLIWRKKYLIFFLFTVIFNWIFLSFINTWNIIWISGFCMALLSYYTLELRSRNNMEYKWWITALIINIWIWFLPWISLYWHLFWAIAWVIYYLITKEFFRRKMVWAVC